MITLGLDIGSEYVKSVLLNSNSVIESAVFQSSDEAGAAAQKVVQQVLDKSSLKIDQIDGVAVTGNGRGEVGFARHSFSDPICQAKGATFLFPEAGTVLALGAHSSIAIKLGRGGKVVNFLSSDKCAGGSGSFLTAMAKVLHTPISDFNELSLKARNKVGITNFCAVFAESEVISLIHQLVPKEDIIAGILDAVCDKLVMLLKRLRVEREVVLTGGVAMLRGVSLRLEEKLGGAVLVPEEPMITGAIGAALLGADRK